MTNIYELKNHIEELRGIKVCAKALYITGTMSNSGGLAEIWDYLWAKVDNEVISEDEADKIVEEITNECANMTMFQINNITNSIRGIGC